MLRLTPLEHPDDLFLQTLDEVTWQQLAEVATMRVEITGCIHEGRIIFDVPSDAPILTHENVLIIGGLHLVINLREETVTV